MLRSKSAFFAALLLFIFCDPYFTWGWLGSSFLSLLIKVILAYLFFTNIDIKTHNRKCLFIGFIVILVLIPIFRGSNIFGILFETVFALLICSLPFAKEKFAWETYDCFLSIYCVIISLSAVVWCLTLVGAIHPMGTIEPLNELKLYSYNVYPLLVRPVVENDVPRFMGPFDEPGVVGTISALLLVIGKFDFRDKRLLIIFLASLLSLSLFLYVIAAIYYLIYTVFVNKNKTLGYSVIALMAIFVIISLGNEDLYEAIWQRFEYDQDSGKFAGDDRLGEVGTLYFLSIVGTNEFYFGLRDFEYFADLTGGSFSIIIAIAQYGFILVLAYLLIFIVYGWKYHKSIVIYLLYIFTLCGTLYQRPCLFEPEFLFFLSLMAMACESTYKTKVSSLVGTTKH